jgi:type I restriction enzyme M protein
MPVFRRGDSLPRLRPFYSLDRESWVMPNSAAKATQREELRQWLLRELFDNYGYPQDWFPRRVRLYEISDFLAFEFSTTGGSPFLKAVIAAEEALPRAIDTLQEELQRNPVGGIGIVSTGNPSKTAFLRVRHDQRKTETLSDIEIFADPRLKIVQPVYDRSNRLLEPLTERVENLLFEAHSTVRDVDGLHPDEALDELCKFIYLKTADETNTANNRPYTLQRSIYGSVEELAATVREAYLTQTRGHSHGVFSMPIRLSSPALARICELLESYSLCESSIDMKGRAFQRVLSPATRSGMGQFFTPLEVIHMIVNIVDPHPEDLVLDPFCGSGHFLTAALKRVPLEKQPLAAKHLFGIEKSDRMVRVATTDMIMNGDGHTHISCADALLDFSNYVDLSPSSFDVVMTNPPFGSVLGRDAIGHLGRFVLAGSRKSVPLEILGLERCIQFLRPGGRLAIVLPDGLLANTSYADVRTWVEDMLKLRAIISLPSTTFTPFGAAVKTSVLIGRKWKAGEVGRNNYPVFLGKLESIGYDATGRKTGDAECEEMIRAATQFLAQEGW